MIVTCFVSKSLQNLQQSQRALVSVPNSAQGILTTLMIIIPRPTELPCGHTAGRKVREVRERVNIMDHELTFGQIALELVLHSC